DWLEERGDPRGAFLRNFVNAVSSGAKKLPSSRSMPKGWRNVVGITLMEELAKAGLSAWKDAVLGLARPAVGITTKPARDDNIPLGTSKFGGWPDLPRGASWPLYRSRPLGFLAQINLTEVAPASACRALPRTGILFFFGMAEAMAFSDQATDEESEWRLIFS